MSKRSQHTSFYLAVRLRSKVFLSAPPNVAPHTDIKALCLLKVSGFPQPVADAASQISPKHTQFTNRSRKTRSKIMPYYPLVARADRQQTAFELRDVVITFWGGRNIQDVTMAAEGDLPVLKHDAGVSSTVMSEKFMGLFLFLFFNLHSSPLTLNQLRVYFHVAHYFLSSMRLSDHKSSFPCDQLNQTQRRRWSWKPPPSC